MRAEMAVCAQRAVDRGNSLIDVYGIGITDIWAPAFPAVGQFAIVLRLALDPAEVRRSHELRVRFMLDDQVLPELPSMYMRVPNPVAGEGGFMNVMLNVQVGIPSEGRLRIEIHVDSTRIPHLHLNVRRGAPPPYVLLPA